MGAKTRETSLSSSSASALPYYRQLISLRLILTEMRRLEWLLPRPSKTSRGEPPADAFLEHFTPLLANLTTRQATALRARVTESIAAALLPDDLESRNEHDADKLCAALIRWQKGGRRPGGHSPLERSVHAMMRHLNDKIALVAPDVEKALDFLQAYVALWPVSSCECLAELTWLHKYGRAVAVPLDRILRHLRAEYQEHQTDPRTRTEPYGHIFWTSGDFREQDDCFQFLVFAERFRPSGFEQVTEAATRLMESWVIETVGEEAFQAESVAIGLGSVIPLRFWPLIEIPETCHAIRPVVDMALRSLIVHQHPNGFWVHPSARETETGVTAASPEATAAATCLLAAYGRRPPANAALEKSISWLLSNQHHDGYWTERVADGPGEPSILATCLAIRALLRMNATDVRDPVQRGTQWLLTQQSASGDWGSGESLVVPREETLLVLNTLSESRSLLARSQAQSEYLDVGLSLAERALEHLADKDVTSLQIAVLLAFQAAEAFLYSCLVTVNHNVFKSGQNETIGFAKALTRLEGHLRSTGELRPGDVLEGRSDLERLKYLRDQVVHKAIVVHLSDARPAVQAGTDLIRRFCAKFHGFEPLNV